MIKQLILVGAAAALLTACGSGEDAQAPTPDAAASDAAAPAADAAAPAAGEEGVAEVAFKLENATPYVLTHLYISPAESNSWNRDILGDQTAPSGATIDVSIDDGVESCMYDFRAQFSNGQHMDVRGVNVCEFEGKTLTVSENA